MATDRIIVFAYDFPPMSGGIARLCYEIAKGQKQYFDEVIVLTRKKEGEYKSVKQANFRLIELSTQRLKCELQAIKVLKQFNKTSTTILCSLWYPEAFLALLSGHKNVYSLAHGAELQAGKSKFRKYIWHPLFAKYILRSVKKVISNSHYTRILVKQISSNSNCVALPLGVDIKQFKPLHKQSNNGKIILGTLSRIHKFKGFDLVLEALLNLPEKIQKNICWKIGGTGPYLDKFKTKLKELSPNFNVEFLGFIPEEDLLKFYNSLNLFILFTQNSNENNKVEGFGLVFLEAQACGIPVIGTNTGGICDAVNHQNGGWLLEQNDFKGLSLLLKTLFEDRSLLNHQGILARERCLKKGSWSFYNKKLFHFIK